MAGEQILVIEDEKDIAELVKYNLMREGYKVNCVSSGEHGLEDIKRSKPDVIFLDLMLPGLNGLDICRTVKGNPLYKGISIIIVTAKSEEADIVTGLELGADDYITKPFSPRVLLARLRAVLRRKGTVEAPAESTIRIHGLVIDPGRYEVLVNEKAIVLTRTEFTLLHLLARRPGWVFTRYQLVNGMHQDESLVTDRTVDVHIAGLRKKLGSAGQYLETIRGVGYRFKENL